jgi:L-threonylcarbamoyladenylate synthase
VALPVPAHPVLAEVLDLLADLGGGPGRWWAAPSANCFGRVSPTTAEHVRAELAEGLGEDVILDAGPCTVNRVHHRGLH